MDDLPIGRRVAYWRARRRMSQQVFADRLGKSKSWVDKVERGVRRLDKFSLIQDIAQVLHVEPDVLVGSAEPARRSGGNGNATAATATRVDIEDMRAALERYDQIGGFFDPPRDAPALPELDKAVQHAWLTYQHAKGGALARTLPDLLRRAQAAEVLHRGTAHSERSAHLLGQVYQITSSSLRNLGEFELAWLAADRAVATAQRSTDELLTGVATFRVGMALLALDRARPALEINVTAANRLSPDGRGVDEERLSVYGMLLLQGAMAAAKLGDQSTTGDLLSAAEEAADWLGADRNHYWSCFGPTNVQLHRVAAAVEMGEGRYAVDAHERIRAEGLAALVPERRVHHMVDMARGWAQMGDVARAGEMLAEGDRLAPAELRSRPVVRELLGDVLRRSNGTPPPAVSELAAQVGVGG